MELCDHSGCEDLEAGWRQPLISYIRAKKSGKVIPPYIPKWELMPVHELCQLALLWKTAGFEKEAGQLAHFLSPLRSFLSLWCHEKGFNEKEGLYWFSRLSEIEPIVPDTMPDFGLTLSHFPLMQAAFTLAGKGTSLGVLLTKEVEIRAMGPQVGGGINFGIQGEGAQGWTRSFAFPEIWLAVHPQCREKECTLDIRFVGLKPDTPLEFAFYVKAQSCQIEEREVMPKSLQRFNGEATTVMFQNLKIESSLPHKVQVIPLAGEGCFWDSDFLAAFEIHPFEPHVRFILKSN